MKMLRNLTPRGWAIYGSLPAVALIAYLTSPGDPPPEPAAEPDAQVGAAAPVAQAGASPPPPPAWPAPAPAASAPAASMAGLSLHGVIGEGAIIATGEESQRYVPVGGQVAPGVTLQAVGQHHAVLASASGSLQLGFGGARPASAPAAGAASAVQLVSGPSAAGPGGEAQQYRAGLAPRRVGGRINGFAVRPGATLPALQRAGLQPGDVLVAVNGEPFESEEKVVDLASEIAGSYTAIFEFERNGQRMKRELQVNTRR